MSAERYLGMILSKSHFGDPCIKCDAPHDEVEVGQCRGILSHGQKVRLRRCRDKDFETIPGSIKRIELSDEGIRYLISISYEYGIKSHLASIDNLEVLCE